MIIIIIITIIDNKNNIKNNNYGINNIIFLKYQFFKLDMVVIIIII